MLGAGPTFKRSLAGANHSSEQERIFPPRETLESSVRVANVEGKSSYEMEVYDGEVISKFDGVEGEEEERKRERERRPSETTVL